mgnify:CR=1 FL=1
MRKTGPDMQKTSPWLIAARVIFTFALIACIVFIFSNSMQIGDVSESASGRVLLLMKKVFTRLGMPGVANHLTDHIVRKLAHFCEYALEGFLLTLCLRVYTRHFFVHISWPILGGLLTALTDETIQMFSDGRSSQLTDVWLDLSGAMAGILVGLFCLGPCAGCAGCSTNIETRIDAMTIEQANEYFSSLPEGFAPAEELRAALTADVQKVQFVGVAGTAGKTAAAGLLAAILREAAFHVGFYRAGCEPLSARIAIGGVSVDPVLLCQAAEALSAAKPLPREAAELAAAARCFGAAGCKLAVVELPDAGLASALPQMPVCAVTAIGPDGVSRSVERLAALAAGVMRKDAVCVTAPEQPKAVLSELVVAAAKAECELVVPDAEDITFLEAEKFTSKVDYGGYTAPLAFLGRHAAGNAAVAVELALALWRKGFEIPDEAILAGLAAVENRSSIRVLSQKPLIILDACRTPQQAAALLRVLNMAKVRHMSAVIGLTEEEGAESFLAALETGLTSEEQKKDKSTMPGMGENPFDKVFLVAPAGTEAALAERLTEKARYHFDAVFCPTLAEAVEQAKANSRRGLLVCGSEAIALEAEKLLENR